MNKIRLALPLFSLLFIVTACPDDDDAIFPQSEELLIGNWLPAKVVDICSQGGEETYTYTSCEQNGTLSLFLDATFERLVFAKNQSGECVIEETLFGTWEAVNSGLTFTFEGGDDDGTTEFFDYIEIDASGNTIRIGNRIYESNEPCNGGTGITFSYTEYSRQIN